MASPTEIHWLTVNKLLRYLKGILNSTLTFTKYVSMNLIVTVMLIMLIMQALLIIEEVLMRIVFFSQ